MEIILEILSGYGLKILAAIVLAIFGGLGLVAKKLAARYLDTELKRTVAKIAARFVEQAWKALHGEEKMQKALEAVEVLLKKHGVAFDADEMRIMIEAAVAEFNEVFAKSWPILEGVAVEDLDDDQLRSLVQQMGFAYTNDMTRQELLAALAESAE